MCILLSYTKEKICLFDFYFLKRVFFFFFNRTGIQKSSPSAPPSNVSLYGDFSKILVFLHNVVSQRVVVYGPIYLIIEADG